MDTMLFATTNAIIAACDAAIALFLLWKLWLVVKLRTASTHPWSVVALVAGVLFLIGNSQTHVSLLIWGFQDKLFNEWYAPWSLVIQILQAIAGILFTVLSVKGLVIRVYDKAHYQEATQRAVSIASRPQEKPKKDAKKDKAPPLPNMP